MHKTSALLFLTVATLVSGCGNDDDFNDVVLAPTATSSLTTSSGTSTNSNSNSISTSTSTGGLTTVTSTATLTTTTTTSDTSTSSVFAGSVANRVFGQVNFTAATGAAGSTGLNGPGQISVEANGGLYVADINNNRVLHYSPGSTVADRVYGQAGDFTTAAGSTGAAGLEGPFAVAVDGSSGVYITDTFNSRVLHFSGSSTTADRVYGQGNNFSTGSSGTSATALRFPQSAAVDPAGGLYVADDYNNRVLHFPGTSTTADRVYGQGGDFTTSANSPVAAASLNRPQSVAVDENGGIFVADRGNSRVLHFAAGSTTADRVYGQGGAFNSNQANLGGPSSTSLSGAVVQLAYTQAQGLYVADFGNNRVLHFSGSSTTADRVYGHSTFTATSFNDGGSPSASVLNAPAGVAIDAGGGLFVSDQGNHRVLFFPVGP